MAVLMAKLELEDDKGIGEEKEAVLVTVAASEATDRLQNRNIMKVT